MKQDHFPGREGARTATAIVAAAGLALLVAACGGSGSASPGVATLPSPSAGSAAPASTTGTPNASDEIAQALAYAQCMRSNGVPNWPDPDSSGVFPKSQIDHLGVSDARLQSAEDACRDLLPSADRPAPSTCSSFGRGRSPTRSACAPMACQTFPTQAATDTSRTHSYMR